MCRQTTFADTPIAFSECISRTNSGDDVRNPEAAERRLENDHFCVIPTSVSRQLNHHRSAAWLAIAHTGTRSPWPSDLARWPSHWPDGVDPPGAGIATSRVATASAPSSRCKRVITMRRFQLLLLVLCGVLWSSPAESADPVPDETMVQQVKRAIVEQTNAFRKEHKLDAVTGDENLMKCASDFANFMAKTSKYGHNADGQTPAQRAKAAGYEYCVLSARTSPIAPTPATLPPKV